MNKIQHKFFIISIITVPVLLSILFYVISVSEDCVFVYKRNSVEESTRRLTITSGEIIVTSTTRYIFDKIINTSESHTIDNKTDVMGVAGTCISQYTTTYEEFNTIIKSLVICLILPVTIIIDYVHESCRKKDIVIERLNMYVSSEEKGEYCFCMNSDNEEEWVKLINCGHKYHKECIEEWWRNRKSESENDIFFCPVCGI